LFKPSDPQKSQPAKAEQPKQEEKPSTSLNQSVKEVFRVIF
jgi:hypothetical protein